MGGPPVKLLVKVVPKSSHNGVVGWMGDTLKVGVTASPERGKANLAVEEVLADALGVAKERVRLVAGLTSPRKVVEIDGLAASEVHRRLATRVRRKRP
ncbi:MAG: DUF167 domain-containing protein [Nitrospinae bacterium]|nr:DUF167 domain-containing protein [Nitrospinota bacterium]